MDRVRARRPGMVIATLVLAMAMAMVMSTAAVAATFDGAASTDQSTDFGDRPILARPGEGEGRPGGGGGRPGGGGGRPGGGGEPPAGGSIAVIGCSNTGQAVEGYHAQVKDPALWPVTRRGSYGLGGGSLDEWAGTAWQNRSKHWEVFDALEAELGITGLWVNICIQPGSGTATDFYDDILVVLQRSGALAGGRLTMPVWFSPLNEYAPGVRPAYDDAVRVSEEVAAWAVDSGLGEWGPHLGPLFDEHLMPRPDPHLNPQGELYLGDVIARWAETLRSTSPRR